MDRNIIERVQLGIFGQSYGIKSAERAFDKKNRSICVTVLFLNDTTKIFNIKKRSKGSHLLELVFEYLELTESDYFGLQFVRQTDVVRWVDPNKIFQKQWSNISDNSEQTSPTLQFRVKFYAADPSRLLENYTRYQFYLQIKRDIYQGKLSCSISAACLLASYTVQSELGDYNSIEHCPGYLCGLQLLNDQNEELERKVSELHELHRGQLPADAQYNYLEYAKRLDMYGIDLYKAVDSAGNHLQLGATSTGLLVFKHNSIRVNTFSWYKMIKVSFMRKKLFIQLRREPYENYDTRLGFSLNSNRISKALWKSCVEHHSFFRLQRPHHSSQSLPSSRRSKFEYSDRTELQTAHENKLQARISKVIIRSPSKRLGSSPVNRVTSKRNTSIPSRKSWELQSDDDGGSVELRTRSSGHSSVPALYNNENVNRPVEDGTVTVKLLADEQRQFGFYVLGGADLKLPIFVSRVLPHTPADQSNPRLSEGDQVLMINGRDVSSMMHEQVVSLIRASREYCRGELILTIKPNALVNLLEEETISQYVIKGDIGHLGHFGGNVLFTHSLQLLSDALASGALLAQYEQMYQNNSHLTIKEAKKEKNVSKNRYRDILPYDSTRVILKNSDNGDYINANYINMEISDGIVNRYIATQGPLHNTMIDFWRMIQQESSHLVIMLTTVIECYRPKCHQYWPSLYDEELELSPGFSVKCITEQLDETGSFVFRELLLCDEKVDEKRTIQHMQYLAWPDHGVPSDPNLFLQFTERMRSVMATTIKHEVDLDGSERDHKYNSPSNPPTIIHCSAGLGRTGVLILMNTALDLMEARKPIYPLDIVEAMRDQRAGMVQNVNQYRFVCKCICEAYAKLTKSLPTSSNTFQ